MTLQEWQNRLAAHFEALASARSADAKRRVFVLEHDLDSAEVAALQESVRAAARRAPDSSTPLPWLVYATELGYRYSGDEYWQTFEEETPGWAGSWDRGWLRDQFLWFHSKFRGIQPIGPWASHFSIISWPITNAILPRDLQLQLARILFEMRYKLNADLFSDAERLGQEIAERSWNSSTRFKNLCEESLLIGQIATALLLEGEGSSASLIWRTTLHRIRADLNREQQSRDFLRKARGVAIERLNVRGLAPNRPATGAGSARAPDADELKRVALEPQLLLRPSGKGVDAWSVFLQVPNLSSLLELVPDSRSVLTESRCRVAGDEGRPLARGRLLQGTQWIPLGTWPKSGEPLLTFEKRNAHFEHVLKASFSMTKGPLWLFRIASDRLAYELKTAGVRSGERYVLLGNGIDGIPYSRAIEIECQGIQGRLLEIPATFAAREVKALKDAGVGVAKSFRIWPAGVGAIVWDGDGRGEWLVTERPCFAIKSDYAMACFSVLVAGKQVELGPLSAGEASFFAFPDLSPGKHVVRLIAQEGPFSTEASLGTLEVFVRPSRAWEAGKGTQGPLLVDVEPLNPTLEQLREGRVDVSIRGPIGRELDCVVRLFERGKESTVFSKRLAKLPLPVTAETWQQYMQRELFRLREVEDLYDSCSVCLVELLGSELGSLSLRFERESVALRWAVRTRPGRQKQIALVSDAAQDEAVAVGFRKFDTPDVEYKRESSSVTAWSDVPTSGGLFFARVGGFASSVIVPPVVHDLASLNFNPTFVPQVRSLQAVCGMMELIGQWADARLTVNLLAGTRQRGVLRAITTQLHCLLCADWWPRVERGFEKEGMLGTIRALPEKSLEKELAISLTEQDSNLPSMESADRVQWLYERARGPIRDSRTWTKVPVGDRSETVVLQGEHGPSDLRWLCEFALRLASGPAEMKGWSGPYFRDALEALWRQPVVARLARLLVLYVEERTGGSSDRASLYSGWGWP